MKDGRPNNAKANQAWGTALARTLATLGIRQVIFSPGSRSTPLILGCESCKNLETIPILDERSAGFFALGLAKRSENPVAVICTSGTAAANLLPAIIEASLTGIPLLLLTADRPPELRDCLTGQSIDQTKLFGTHVRWYHELAIPSFNRDAFNYLRQTTIQALKTATGLNAGPVHINCPFREPFFEEETWKNPPMPNGFSWNHFLKQARPPIETSTRIVKNLSELQEFERWIIVTDGNLPIDAVSNVAKKLNAPTLAGAFSSIREKNFMNRILHFENLLRDETFRTRTLPDAVLSLGPLPTSKTLRKWIGELDLPTWVIGQSERNTDALHRRAVHLTCDLHELAEALPEIQANSDWIEKWKIAEAKIEKSLDETFTNIDDLFEGKAARILSEKLPRNSNLVLANSMPVRDMEWFGKPGNCGKILWGNRAANGIDGTLSTALGVAHASESATFLLTGDLAFLHDANGLLAKNVFEGKLIVVVVNNRGGGIFENLQVANITPFEKCFATPQEINIGKLCQSHGIPHSQPDDWKTFEILINEPMKQGIRVIEILTDRKADTKMRQSLLSIGPSN